MYAGTFRLTPLYEINAYCCPQHSSCAPHKERMDSMANFLTPHKVVLGTLTRCYVDRQAIDAGDPSTVDLG